METSRTDIASRETGRVSSRWTDVIFNEGARARAQAGRAAMVVGILRGEGIGREVTDAALRVLAAVEERFGYEFECREGGLIGLEGDMRGGGYLSDEVAEWSRGIFAEGAAILAGAGGGRFVYDIRRRFDLYCKVNPIKPMRVLDDVSRVRMEAGRELDLLVLRENLNGLYQGEAKECDDAGERVVELG